ncbi:MAG TPA: hypothetical protein VGE72_03075 [Azospirillum sp.]
MSRYKFEVAFDGPALASHEIDVQDLAPALLGLSDLIKAANAEFNGERSAVKLLARADADQHCFNIGLEVVQSTYDAIKGFLGYDGIKTAKELLEWLGLVFPSGALGLITYWRVKNGRKVKSVAKIESADRVGFVAVQFNGSAEKHEVHNHIYNMGENKSVADAAEKTFRPLDSTGVDKVTIRVDGRVASEIDHSDLIPVKRSYDSVRFKGDEQSTEPQTIISHLRVYAPVFDPKADNWRFVYGGKPIYADISETNIAKDAIRRGGASVGDTYKVKLEITEYVTAKNQFKNSYKIKEVLSFEASPYQMGMFDDIDDEDE